MKLSIIIPTLNEEKYLPGTVQGVRRRAVLGPPHEIIVADCASGDGTRQLAQKLGALLLGDAPPPDSRAAALNRGAELATGEVLLFLDADTLPPRGYDRAIRTALRRGTVIGGAFEFRLSGAAFGLRVVELINRVRYRLWPRYYGDQGIFVRREAFQRVGGYPERSILEASDFSRRLWRLGPLALVHQYMTTSPRRFLEGGICRVLAGDVRLWWLDLLGLPTERFGPAYWENNRQRGRVEQASLHLSDRVCFHDEKSEPGCARRS
jgi:glycosyltransferase involved in cell wall biosynthesis